MANVHRLNMGDRRPNEEPLLPHFANEEMVIINEMNGPTIDPRHETFWQFLRTNVFFRVRHYFPLCLCLLLCILSFCVQLGVDGINRRTINDLSKTSFLQIDFMGPYTGSLDLGTLFVRQGEVYRILTALFLHGDFSHLLVNCLATLAVGSILEVLITPFRLFVLILGSGMAGNIFALCWQNDNTVGFGFSTSICGLIGALLGYLIFNWKNLAATVHLRMLLTMQVSIFLLMVMIGATSILDPVSNAQVGHAAHFGGFISGTLLASAVCGSYLKASTPSASQLKYMYRVRIVGGALTFLFVVGSAVVSLKGK